MSARADLLRRCPAALAPPPPRPRGPPCPAPAAALARGRSGPRPLHVAGPAAAGGEERRGGGERRPARPGRWWPRPRRRRRRPRRRRTGSGGSRPGPALERPPGCSMRVRRGLLRLPRRSLLAALFFFSLSSSLLYFVYVAPGIGRKGAWDPGGVSLWPRGDPGNPRPAPRRPQLSEDPRLEGDLKPGPQKITGTPARPLGDPTPGPRGTPEHSRSLHPDGLWNPPPHNILPPTSCPPLTPSGREPDCVFTHTLVVPGRPHSRFGLLEPSLSALRLLSCRSPSPGSPSARVPGIPRTPNLRGPPASPRGAPVPGSRGVPPSPFPSILLLSPPW